MHAKRWFIGAEWGRFYVVAGVDARTGAPSIDCYQANGNQFGIAVDRWISERKRGAIVPLFFIRPMAKSDWQAAADLSYLFNGRGQMADDSTRSWLVQDFADFLAVGNESNVGFVAENPDDGSIAGFLCVELAKSCVVVRKICADDPDVKDALTHKLRAISERGKRAGRIDV